MMGSALLVGLSPAASLRLFVVEFLSSSSLLILYGGEAPVAAGGYLQCWRHAGSSDGLPRALVEAYREWRDES